MYLPTKPSNCGPPVVDDHPFPFFTLSSFAWFCGCNQHERYSKALPQEVGGRPYERAARRRSTLDFTLFPADETTHHAPMVTLYIEYRDGAYSLNISRLSKPTST